MSVYITYPHCGCQDWDAGQREAFKEFTSIDYCKKHSFSFTLWHEICYYLKKQNKTLIHPSEVGVNINPVLTKTQG